MTTEIQIVTVLGTLGLIIGLTRAGRWFKARKSDAALPIDLPRTNPAVEFAEPTEQNGLRAEVESLLCRLEQFATTVNDQVETSLARLNTSIRRADRRIDALRKASAALEPRQPHAAAAQPSVKPQGTDAVTEDDSLPIRLAIATAPEVEDTTEESRSESAETICVSQSCSVSTAAPITAESATTTAAAEVASEPRQTAAAAAVAAEAPQDTPDLVDASTPSAPDERFMNVYHLADSGRLPVEIARSLGMPAGEIELILNLRRAG